jgi:hypothetical protein
MASSVSGIEEGSRLGYVTAVRAIVARAIVPGYRLVAAIALVLVVGAFLVLKAFAFIPREADEGIYTYAAFRFANGALPYRDFFFAHPPFHLAWPAMLFWVFNTNDPSVAKWVLLLSALVQIMAAVVLVRRMAPLTSAKAATLAAASSAVLLTFSLSFLGTTSYDVGVVQATSALAVAAVLLTRGMPALAGISAGIAVMTAVQAGPLALTMVVGVFLHNRRTGVRFGIAFAVALIVTNLLCFAFAGREFVEQVYLFHFRKLPSAASGWQKLFVFLKDSLPLVLPAIAGAVAVVARAPHLRKFVYLALGGALLHGVLMATRPSVFYFYFHPMLLPLAIIAGCGLSVATHRLLTEHAGGTGNRLVTVLRGGALLAAALLAYSYAPASRESDEYRDGASVTAGEPRWSDAPGLGALNGVLKDNFWANGPVETYSNVITRYLRVAADESEHLGRLAGAIRALAAQRPNLSLFGDSTFIPWLAITAKVPIAADLIDTNDQRISAGYLSAEQIARALAGSPHTVLVFAENGIIRFDAMKDYVNKHYRPINRIYARSGRAFTIYERRS